jgi:NAD(P)-dependent dehydrogenase (short-subunit alcohol dehydrogenase family)
MKIHDATVLITGANRGLGLAFAREALARGARKVYAGVRDPSKLTLPGVEALRLDVTRAEDVAAAASRCTDVALLINNAGIAAVGGFLSADSIDSARAQLETNFFDPLRLSQAFAPVLAARGGGAILNVLSVASWINSPMLAMYGASKSAAWALTNGLRHELRAQGHPGAGHARGLRRYRPDTRHRSAQVEPGADRAAHPRCAGRRRRRGAGRRACTPAEAGAVGRTGCVSAGPERGCAGRSRTLRPA